ncbi:hypothetical protein A2U01_0094737, partial [Trifolium medium]|nr:hypothetical protein [Trifolium medium]
QALALSLKENGKRRSRIASGSTPLAFSVSTYYTNTDKWRFGSSVGEPENWFCCTICNIAGFNSKFLASMVGGAILE